MPDDDLPDPDDPVTAGAVEGDPAPAPAAASAGRGTLIASIVAGLFVVVSVVLLLLLVRLKSDHDDLKAEQQDHASAQTTAAQVAEALVHWDPSGHDQERQTLEQLVTRPLLDQYDGAMQGLDKSLPAFGISSAQARVQQVFVGDVGSSEANVVVVYDLAVVGTNPAVVPDRYLSVHLSKIDGRWRVDNAQDVNSALASLGSTGGTSGTGTTTTTAPPAGSGG